MTFHAKIDFDNRISPWPPYVHKKTSAGMYYRWLLSSVLLRGRSTVWCAKQIDMDHDEVLAEFEGIIEECN